MLHLKLIRRCPLNCKKFKGLWWLSPKSLSDAGPPEDETDTKEKKRRLFGTDLPYGIRDAKDAKYMAEELDMPERRLVFDALRKKMADQYLEQKRLGQAEIHHDDLVRVAGSLFRAWIRRLCLDDLLQSKHQQKVLCGPLREELVLCKKDTTTCFQPLTLAWPSAIQNLKGMSQKTP
ncbi:hypothetical protein TELCIR_01492 [Teladorsagia circumcincta]|uniref:Uncharacterized protein n=1 Tax=Teladorsagia circumcincta TaxID=45464 RepID=A0A2G9V1R8_TELCI|nr:hypothetical protein TELCIR_01492 [Teladorsagia circumcincta]